MCVSTRFWLILLMGQNASKPREKPTEEAQQGADRRAQRGSDREKLTREPPKEVGGSV
jgi:hypothetical protein